MILFVPAVLHRVCDDWWGARQSWFCLAAKLGHSRRWRGTGHWYNSFIIWRDGERDHLYISFLGNSVICIVKLIKLFDLILTLKEKEMHHIAPKGSYNLDIDILPNIQISSLMIWNSIFIKISLNMLYTTIQKFDLSFFF